MAKAFRRDVVLVIMIVSMFALTVAVTHAQEFKAELPVAMTAPGQSAEIAMVNLLAKRVGLKIKSESFLPPEELTGMKTLIIILGASGKGLGEAGVDLPSEVNRAKSLIATAKKGRIKLIGMHLGGAMRRGENSQVIIDAIASEMDCLVVRADGNKDGLFTKIAEKQKIPLFQVKKTLEVGDLLKKIFSP